MNNFRHKADLRVSIILQAVQKAMLSILKASDHLVSHQTTADRHVGL